MDLLPNGIKVKSSDINHNLDVKDDNTDSISKTRSSDSDQDGDLDLGEDEYGVESDITAEGGEKTIKRKDDTKGDDESNATHAVDDRLESINTVKSNNDKLTQDDRASADGSSSANFDSKFYAIRTTGGQERVVANVLQNKIRSRNIGIYSILLLENFKGYIIVEAPDANVAFQALAGVRHIRGQIRGEIPFKDIEGYLVKKPVVTELAVDDTVEVIGGPFKAMKAKITRVDYEKQEATVVLLDSPYQIPVTVDANYLKKVLH